MYLFMSSSEKSLIKTFDFTQRVIVLSLSIMVNAVITSSSFPRIRLIISIACSILFGFPRILFSRITTVSAEMITLSLFLFKTVDALPSESALIKLIGSSISSTNGSVNSLLSVEKFWIIFFSSFFLRGDLEASIIFFKSICPLNFQACLIAHTT